MIELHLKRIAKRPTYTIGRLSTRRRERGTLTPFTYFCDTLEPHWVDFHHGGRKTKGKTAIPEGRYPIVVTMSPRFHRWLPLLVGVPHYRASASTAATPPRTPKAAYSWVKIPRSAASPTAAAPSTASCSSSATATRASPCSSK